LDFLEAPPAFKKLIERFDGTVLPPPDALGMMLSSDASVPKSWQDRVAGFFLRSAKYAGAIDDKGHLRVKATREMPIDPPPAEREMHPPVPHVAGQIKPPEVNQAPRQPFREEIRRVNTNPRTLSLSDSDPTTGEQSVVFAEVPSNLTLATWNILHQWVQSIKPKDETISPSTPQS
jgi:hypothetical protein